jgi:hypothetical protein
MTPAEEHARDLEEALMVLSGHLEHLARTGKFIAAIEQWLWWTKRLLYRIRAVSLEPERKQ